MGVRYIIFEVVKHIYDARSFYNFALASKMCRDACRSICSNEYKLRFCKCWWVDHDSFEHSLPNGVSHGFSRISMTTKLDDVILRTIYKMNNGTVEYQIAHSYSNNRIDEIYYPKSDLRFVVGYANFSISVGNYQLNIDRRIFSVYSAFISFGDMSHHIDVRLPKESSDPFLLRVYKYNDGDGLTYTTQNGIHIRRK